MRSARPFTKPLSLHHRTFLHSPLACSASVRPSLSNQGFQCSQTQRLLGQERVKDSLKLLRSFGSAWVLLKGYRCVSVRPESGNPTMYGYGFQATEIAPKHLSLKSCAQLSCALCDYGFQGLEIARRHLSQKSCSHVTFGLYITIHLATMYDM